MSIGSLVDAHNFEFKEHKPSSAAIFKRMTCDSTTAYAKIFDLQDVCKVLDISEAYALKVLVGAYKNEAVSACLDAIGNKNTFSMIFRSTLKLQELEPLNTKEDNSQAEVENIKPNCRIQSLQIGNELIAIMTVTINDTQKVLMVKLKDEIALHFPDNFGYLDSKRLSQLYPRIHTIDKLLNEAYSCRIRYISFDDLDKRPKNFQGLIKSIFLFRKSADRWATIYRSRNECSTVSGELEVRDKENNAFDPVDPMLNESSSLLKRFWIMFGYTCDAELDAPLNIDRAQSRDFFYMKATLNIPKKITLAGYESETRLQMIGKYLVTNRHALAKIEGHMKCSHNFSQQDKREGDFTVSLISMDIKNVSDFVEKISFDQVPFDKTIDDILKRDRIKSVNRFIKNTNLKLPNGPKINLLLMGKGNHGKSSTGNSILGQDKFKCHTSTLRPSKEWTEVDGRDIEVVDTSDLCDLKNIDKTICDSIVYCHGGFHAILLVLRYPFAVSRLEIKAINMLKKRFGEDIILKRCICIFTHGDKFELHKTTSFKKWCLRQEGLTKQLLEECNYRCVLFYNKTNNDILKKRQLFKLLEFLESFDRNVFHNELFDLFSSDKVKMEEEIIKGIEKVKMKYAALMDGKVVGFQSQLGELIVELNILKNKSAGESPEAQWRHLALCSNGAKIRYETLRTMSVSTSSEPSSEKVLDRSKLNYWVQHLAKILNKNQKKVNYEDVHQIRFATNKLLHVIQQIEKPGKDAFVRHSLAMDTLITILQVVTCEQTLGNVINIFLDIVGKQQPVKRASLLVSHGLTTVLFHILKLTHSNDLVLGDEILIAIHTLLSRIGHKDRKFAVKARLHQSLMVTLNLVKTHSHNFKNLQPLLQVLKFYTSN
ncbi:cytosolic carboxypeptidase 1 isoform X3, partial [Biomphalaria glabrata]